MKLLKYIHFLFLWFLFFFSFLATEGLANPWKHLKQGDQTAETFLNQLESKKNEAGDHPFYQGHSEESQLQEGDLTGRAQSIVKSNPASQMIHESSDVRPQIKIDLQTDPLLTGSQEILSNPLEIIGGKGTHEVEVTQGGEDETLTCEEPGEDTEHACYARLNVTITQTLGPRKSGSITLDGPFFHGAYNHLFYTTKPCKKHFVAHITQNPNALKGFISQQKGIPFGDFKQISSSNDGGWVKIGHKAYTFGAYTVRYTYQSIVKTPGFSWTNSCGPLEERADQGLCYYVSKRCTQGPQTRTIQGVPVTKDCWEETYTYRCTYPSQDNCGPLRARGCVQINSKCKQKVGNTCVVYTQTYECKGTNQTTYQIAGGKTPFCMDGNCRNQGWERNDEMLSTLAQLSLLKELQGQIENGTLFKGEDNRCTKQPLSFKDCCGSGKGWGNDLGLTSCSAGEKLLSQKRKKGLCHYIGTYCAKKVLGKCVKKKATYCCFGSKLLKAFHTQGRSQIGLGWGEPKTPLCRGFTIDEVQRIDFSKLDLREVFEELVQNFKPSKLQNTTKQVNDRIDVIKKGIKPNSTNQPKQRKEG